MKRQAHAEFPHSRTRHMVSNVRIRNRTEDEIEVGSSFITYRTKDGVTDTYFGSNRYRLVIHSGKLRIREKRCLLDSDGLRTQGRVSIILWALALQSPRGWRATAPSLCWPISTRWSEGAP
jgi:p-cumate 2,3-dioxygenase beta subunit